jgi:hypothetical protein
MGRGFNIPCVGGKKTMGRESKYPGYVVKIPWVGGNHNMSRGIKISWGFDIQWVGAIYHG